MRSISAKLLVIFTAAAVPVGFAHVWLNGSVPAISAAAVLALLILAAAGRRLASSIRRLCNAADAIAVGDYRKRVKLATGDELQSLAESLNAMAEGLLRQQQREAAQTQMLTAMVEAARVASQSLDLAECGSRIAAVVCTHLGASDAEVFVREIDGVRSIGRAGASPDPAWARLAARAAESGEYLVVTEQELGAGASGAVPLAGIALAAGSETVGAIVVRYRDLSDRSRLALGSVRAEVLRAFGVHAAAAVSNAQAYSRAERYSELLEDWLDHLRRLMHVSDAISPSLDLDQTLTALARAAARAMRADQCAIFLPRSDGALAIAASWGTAADALGQVVLRPGEGESGRAFLEKTTVACPDALESQDPTTRLWGEKGGLRGVLSTPLLVEGAAIGALTVSTKQPRQFSTREVALISAIGLHAAVVVRNADLYTRQQSIAESLQRGIMSSAPEHLAGLKFAGRYVPALDEARVGGDFYDVMELPNGKIAIVMADVCGKGLSAAMHVAACKYMTRAFAYAHADDPAAVLTDLNEAMSHHFDLNSFVTIFYAIVDPVSAELVYANAGHPPPLLISQDSRLHTHLAITGTPVGAGAGGDYQARRIDVHPSDVLLLYTDGVTDAIIDGKPLGLDGLHSLVFKSRKCIPDSREASLQQFVDYLCNTLTAAREPPHKDDIAILAVSFEGIAAAALARGGRSGRFRRSSTRPG